MEVQFTDSLFTQWGVNNNVSKYSWKFPPTAVTLSTYHPLLGYTEDCARKVLDSELAPQAARPQGVMRKLPFFLNRFFGTGKKCPFHDIFPPSLSPFFPPSLPPCPFKLVKIPGFQMSERSLTLQSFRTSSNPQRTGRMLQKHCSHPNDIISVLNDCAFWPHSCSSLLTNLRCSH